MFLVFAKTVLLWEGQRIRPDSPRYSQFDFSVLIPSQRSEHEHFYLAVRIRVKGRKAIQTNHDIYKWVQDQPETI
jgi:hypothetical protein